jgi:plastocyanin
MTHLEDGWHDRCAAFAFRRTDTGWVLDGTFVPPNADLATGIADAAGCFGWGYEGGISDAGDRVAMWGAGRVDVYRRDASGWALEQEIVLPVGDGCGATAAPRRLGFSGDGGSLIASDPDCRAGRRAYVYERLGPAWVQTATLTDVAAEDVSISDGGILVTINTAVYAKDATGWHRRTTLSVPGSLHLGCPAIVRNGTRIVCGSIEDVGYNRSQGVVYVFDAAEGGWGNGAIMTARLFAPDGFAADGLTMSGMLRWSMAAVTDDGTSILAPMMPDNVAAGLNPHDLMGYGFTSATPAVAVSIADTGFVPASVTVAQGTTITWTNRGTRSHTATDSTGMRLFASGTLAVGASYSFTFAAAGVYPYRSAVPEPSPLTGRVKVPLRVSPSTGGTTTSFAVTWASGVPPSGYVEDVQERFKACASCAWGAWTSWKSGQTAVSASFVPSHGKGTYAFRARIRKLSNGTASNWSPVTSITVT